MSVSYSNVQNAKMELTPMRVSFQGPGATAFTDLGGTLSKVVIDIKYEKAPIMADQLGTEPIDRVVKAFAATITTEITQVQDKNLWKVVFPHATAGGTVPNDYVLFESKIGDHDQANSGTLLLHPLSKDNTELNFDFTFFNVCSAAMTPLSYGPDGQVTLKVVWNVLPDLTKTPPRWLVYGNAALLP